MEEQPVSGARQLRMVIIGAGPGGICSGVRLRQARLDDFVILERRPWRSTHACHRIHTPARWRW